MMDQIIEFQNIWNDVRDVLEKRLAPQTFENTFVNVKRVVKEENGVVYILVPSNHIKHTINSAYYQNIDEILKTKTKKTIRFKFITEEELNNINPLKGKVSPLSKKNLNMNFTFESFVVGDSNRMAFLTALKVADRPAELFNPLYIFGGVGLGKTHLMQAIGNYIELKDIDYKVVYVQANDYLTDYIKATRDNNIKAFEEKYENIDVLLIDDIQMLTDKSGTQQQFFNLFESMVNNNKQIVITSDCPPSKLNGFMDRLKSRFQMGISQSIDHPDLQQRIKILKQKASEKTDITISEDILEYIAENFIDNVRELEGALNRVINYAEIFSASPTLEIAKDALDVLIKTQKKSNNANYEDALSIIADFYDITLADLLSSSRNQKYVLPRHVCMYILKTKYGLTYSRIGNILNGRDHTTVMNGCSKIEEELKSNDELKLAVESVIKKL
jgi:chromosomal replication initiator protein